MDPLKGSILTGASVQKNAQMPGFLDMQIKYVSLGAKIAPRL